MKTLLVVLLLLGSVALAAPSSHTFAFLRTGPKQKEVAREAAQEAMRGHMANIGRLAEEEKLCIAGPFGSPSPEPALRGLFIFATPDVPAAERLCQSDPAIAAGLLAAEVVPFQTEKNLPEVLRRSMQFEAKRKADPSIKMADGMRMYVLVFADEAGRAAQALAPLRAAGTILLEGTFGGARQGHGLFLLDARELAAAQTLLADVKDAMGPHTVFPWYATVELGRR